MKKRNRKNNKMEYGSLEKREMFAGISLESVAGRPSVVIDGSNGNDVAEVRTLSNGQVEFTLNNTTETFARNQFERIRFLGRSGNDTFRNNTDINSFAAGHNGNDNLQGGDGHNWLRGGNGNDTITGGDRNDLIRGGNGNDTVDGGNRHDRLFGESGVDSIFGGQGNDRIDAGDGNDSINGGVGQDVILYDRVFAQYGVTGTLGDLTVVANSGNEGRDSIANSEVLRFSDGSRQAEPERVDFNEAEQRSLTLHNQLRQSNNLSSLTPASDLSDFAENWSRNMSQNGFRHSTSAQRSHLMVGDRTSISENIVFHGDTSLTHEQVAQQFHDLWVNSPAHFNNMTDATKTEIGIGLVRTSNGWWGTVVFAG